MIHFSLVTCLLVGSSALEEAAGSSTSHEPAEKIRICKAGGQRGTIFPANPLGQSDEKMKAIIYGFLLLYSFIGVSIVADMFMAAIERITSKKRHAKVPGTNRYITTNRWNETVANLTLMALGSSAPEILLAMNDIFKNRFHAGELGPSTIVGSAAFNLFVIIAVCINAIPPGETRQIKETGVFFITAAFSVLAYIWLLFIVQVNTPDIIDVSEGVITVGLLPILVWVSYASDSGLFDKYAVCARLGLKSADAREKDATLKNDNEAKAMLKQKESDREGNKMSMAIKGRGLGKNGKDAAADPTEEDEEEAGALLFVVLIDMACQALKRCFGCFCAKLCCICRKRRHHSNKKEDAAEEEDDSMINGEGFVNLEDPTVLICDDQGNPLVSEAGIITFKNESLEVVGDLEERQHQIVVLRKNSVEGRVSCKYRMEMLTATPGFDFVEEEGTVDFKNGIDKAHIEITILPKEIGEKSDQFQIILEEATNEATFNSSSDGGEDQCVLTISILNANPATGRMAQFYGFLDSWLNLDEVKQGSAAWYEQVSEAYYVNGTPEAQEEAGFLDWVTHVIFFPWKIIYGVLTPPPPYLGGWVCFCIALIHIGILTALIGDMAELFGCVAGIPDNITAISVVALGTSLPDLFASKAAATQDEWADASIVNVTGSNSVNVFLGIGLPWMMAAIYWTIMDATQDELWMEKYSATFLDKCPTGCFVVESGDLTFSVIVFTLGALVCLMVIRIRRVVFDGELGGPVGSDSKACSSFLLVLLWVFYIALSCWKSLSGVDDWVSQILAIIICIPILIALMIFFGVMLQLLKVSKEYIGEEGFFGIAIAVAVLFVRMIYFFMFQ